MRAPPLGVAKQMRDLDLLRRGLDLERGRRRRLTVLRRGRRDRRRRLRLTVLRRGRRRRLRL